MRHAFVLFCIAPVVTTGILFLRAGDLPRTGPDTEKRFPPLKLPPGFKATLFACDPLIEYPSVIAAGPKPGAIFVAVDYMTGLGSDGKVKSEIRLVEDTDGDGYADKVTVVSKGFNSIQGLAYHDETLFVMHAPFLTSVRGKERKDVLSGLGLKPEDNASRLHSANGVVVGHDGWLYLALGDNGVNVPRPEGDRLIHNGGAILRCRPDGRDLHIFSTGLRNIYDIALDAELNVFTRDNENDGGTYMIRMCHSFFGADHGYPYDYYERPDHALKPIGDFGLGSSAGGVCYLETQFPPPYRGNLFFCEWGKSLVRYEPKRSGSGFAPVKEIEFATGNSKDTYPFKPTDVVVQRDGTLMVSDYADGQRPKRGRGRIYHIRHVGDPDTKKEPQPISRLDSASYFDRWEAQSAIERGGKKALAEIAKVPVGPVARTHLVWARARIEGAGAIPGLLRSAKEDPDIGVRIQAIRAIADLTDPILVTHKLDAGRGDAEVAKALAEIGGQLESRVRREVIITLGRMRWADAPAWLNRTFPGPDAVLAHAAMHTMRRADNWPGVLKILDMPTMYPMRQIALRALADQHEPVAVDDLIARLRTDETATRRREYGELLTRVYKKPGLWKYWGYRPGPRPANTVAWEKTDAIEHALDAALTKGNRDSRMGIFKAMQREKVPVRAATLARWLDEETSPETAALLLTALKDDAPADVRPSLKAVVLNPKHSADNRIAALNMLVNDKDADRLAILTTHAKRLEDGPVLAHVLRRLAIQAHQDDAAARVIEPKLKSPDGEVRAAAMWGLGHMSNTRALPHLAAFLSDKDVRVRRAAASAAHLAHDDKEAIKLVVKLGNDPDIETRRACLISLRALHDENCAPLAAAALDTPELTATALMCLRDRGSPKHADAVIALAKRDVRADVLPNAIMALSEWGKQTPSNALTEKMNRAIAEIHGTHGVLVRWRPIGPLTADERIKTIDAFAKKDSSPPHAKLKEHFAFNLGGRVELSRNDDPKTPIWLAYADIAALAPTNVEFLGSSGGSFEVFLNGKSIHRRAKPAKFQPDSDRFAATLEKGVNRVLVQTGDSFAVEFDLRFRRKSSKAEHERLTQAALSRPGNAERGKKVFLDKERAQCIKCHRLADQGERIGPDLTGVGSRFSRIHVIESILEPSRTIAPSFGAWTINLKTGKTLTGVKLAETDMALTIADTQGVQHTIAKTAIDEANPSPISTMPDGLEQRLSADEFVDLVAFLMSQKQTGERR